MACISATELPERQYLRRTFLSAFSSTHQLRIGPGGVVIITANVEEYISEVWICTIVWNTQKTREDKRPGTRILCLLEFFHAIIVLFGTQYEICYTTNIPIISRPELKTFKKKSILKAELILISGMRFYFHYFPPPCVIFVKVVFCLFFKRTSNTTSWFRRHHLQNDLGCIPRFQFRFGSSLQSLNYQLGLNGNLEVAHRHWTTSAEWEKKGGTQAESEHTWQPDTYSQQSRHCQPCCLNQLNNYTWKSRLWSSVTNLELGSDNDG